MSFAFSASGKTIAANPPNQDAAGVRDIESAAPLKNNNAVRHPGLSKWLHMLDTNELAEIENSSVMAFAPQVPGDLARILKSIGEEKGNEGLLHVLLLTLASNGVGFFIVFGTKFITRKRIAQLKQMSPPDNDSLACLWAGFVRSIPDLTSMALLAVGFGAQKLVSDVLSGFFFLLDDAFRVGEYIQAGSIKGTVETITLRNVMLRHHLGMLQVVPYTDLGAVNNFMRGGIVIKFPLEFPYDTDIDLVRRIIKKVGQAMLEDEELGDGFIQPVKSQGGYEITNSVMVIRVKFTAKPGKQFLIKREAFRRLTEAFNQQGIYYVHRKVIVDFPHDAHKGAANEETRIKLLEAGDAKAVPAEIEQQPLAEAGKKEEGIIKGDT